MITTLRDTTSSDVASKLSELKGQLGSEVMGRVLTLIVCVADMIDVDQAIEVSDAASREHPCRVIVVVDPTLEEGSVSAREQSDDAGRARLNAQLRVGGEAGASEIVILEPHGEAANALDTLVMPLLLPDTPVVTYWPKACPVNPSSHPLGQLAVRRITDIRDHDVPLQSLTCLAQHYQPGDTDLSWSGVTLWRAQLASMIQTYPTAITDVALSGHSTHPSTYLIGAWLKDVLDVPVTVSSDDQAVTVTSVTFHLEGGAEASLIRHPGSAVAHQQRPSAPALEINLARRLPQDCLMEELRRLDPDFAYGHIVTDVLPTMSEVQAQLRFLAEQPEESHER